MAFGGIGGSGENIELKVTLDTATAEREAAKLKTDVENAFKRIQGAASSPISSIKELANEFGKTSPTVKDLTTKFGGFGSSFGGLATKATIATAAVAAFAVGINELVKIAADGDKFQDVSDAFQDNADKAGVAADVIEGRLSAAFTDQLGRTELLIQANKAFAAGIDPQLFDDLAAAAKRYADATGGDAVQSLDQLIQGVNTGRESLLKKFGTVKDGVLILSEFTAAEYELAKANRNVTDTYEFFSAKLRNVYEDFAIALNNSDALKLAIEALGSVFTALAVVASEAGQVILTVFDFLARRINDVVSGISASVVFTSEILRDLTNGELPDLKRATAEAAKQFGVFEKATGKAATVSIKLKKELEGVGSTSTKVADKAKEAADKVGEVTKETTIAIEKAFGFKSILETRIQKEVAEAFKAFKGNDPELVSALDKINKSILDGITDPEKAKEAASTLVKTIEEEIAKGKITAESGTIFGIDSGLGQVLSSAIEGAISQGLSLAAKAITTGVGREDVTAISGALGTALGAAIGAAFGSPEAGAAIGGIVGQIVGEIAKEFNGDTSGTEARKSVDKFFADAFNADRLSVIVNGEVERIKDLVVNGSKGGKNGLFGAIAGATLGFVTGGLSIAGGSQFGRGKPDSFADGTFDDALAAQEAKVQGFFAAAGTGFESLLGVSEEISGQVGAILFNNIGGSLVNLQAVIQSTGKTFEEFGDAMFTAFFNGEIGLQALQDGLVKLNELFQIGIPGEIGAIDQAVQNLQISLQDDKGSRIIFNSLKAIGQESIEAGKNLGQAAVSIAQGLGVGAEKVTLFLQAMKLAGINSVQELVAASNAQLAALGANILQITQGGTPTNSTVAIPENSITSTPNFSTPRLNTGSGASRGASAAETAAKKAAQERERLLQQLRSETERLLNSSDRYNNLLKSIGDNERENTKIGTELQKLYKGQFSVLQDLEKAQTAYDKAIQKGASGKELAKLAKNLNDASKAAKDFNKSINNSARADLSGIVKYIQSVNTLGVVAKSVGINVDDLTATLVQGFLRGKLSIAQVNEQLTGTRDLLGQGIPRAVGAVTEAFDNLVKGGRNGGVFSLDAFRDIFAEFDELFGKNSGASRTQQINILRKNLDATRDALQSGIDGGKTPQDLDILRKAFNDANRALSEFQSIELKPELEDLRSELKKTYSAEQVDVFFRALGDSGINTFDDFKNAGDEAVIRILGTLDTLGFDFAASVDANTQKIIDEFDKANNALTDGKDILDAQLTTIRQLNEAAGTLATTFTESAGPAIGTALQGPLASIATEMDRVLFNLNQFKAAKYDKDILLNVSLNPTDSRTQSLLDLLFGDGAGSVNTPTGPGTGGGGLSAEETKELKRLQALRKKGRLSAADRKRFEALRRKQRNG